MFEEESDHIVTAMPESSSEHPKEGALADQNSWPDSSLNSSSIDMVASPHQSSSSPAAESVDKIASLLQFASYGDVKKVQEILDLGLDVDSTDYDGRTALHLAASDGHYGVVELLLDRKANVNPVDRFNDTPLVNATRMIKGDSIKVEEYEEICTLLLDNGGRGTKQLGNKQAREQAQEADEWDQREQLKQLQAEYEIESAELGIKNGKVTESLKVIGTGSYGVVHLVNWRGTKVAAKMILQRLEQREEIKKEFKMELLLLQSLRHPNIVEFLGAVTKTDPLVIVTEYLANGDLHEIIQRRGRIPAKTAVAYALDIARGMNYLHQNKPKAIVHRDLKPRNLLQDEAGHLKVADFGLSKLLEPRSQKEKDGLYHMTGGTGTYRYMAPEVFLHKKYDKSVDVFSFGIIVNEMFEGRPAQQTDPGDEVALARARSDRRPSFFAKTYPPAMKKLLKECWDDNPKKRPKFERIIKELEQMQKDLKTTSRWSPKPISDAVDKISERFSRLVSNNRGNNETGGSRKGKGSTRPTPQARGEGSKRPTSEDSGSFPSSLWSPISPRSHDDSSVSGRRQPALQQEEQQPTAAAATAKQSFESEASTSSPQPE